VRSTKEAKGLKKVAGCEASVSSDLLSALQSGQISLSEFLNRAEIKKTGRKLERVYEGWNAVEMKKIKRARVICKLRNCVHNEVSIDGCTAPKLIIEWGKCYAFEKSR